MARVVDVIWGARERKYFCKWDSTPGQIIGLSRSTRGAEIPGFLLVLQGGPLGNFTFGVVDHVEQHPLSEPKLT
jgi:hypothetical protein